MKLTARYLGTPDRPPIGELIEAADQRVYFQFDVAWSGRGLELSPVYLPAATSGAVPTPTPGFGPLFGLFEDSLPDWWGERLMRRYFGQKGIPWRRVGPLQRLAARGFHGIGAIGYEPDDAPDEFRARLAVEIGDLTAEAQQIIEGQPGGVLNRILRSGMTAGGAQPKALVHFSPDFSSVWPSGGDVPDGCTAWVLKFQMDPDLPDTREEHAYHLMAAAAGIDVPETRLLADDSGRAHFLSRRFDRRDRTPVHLHSFSGLTHTLPRDGFDYGELMELARGLCRDEAAVREIFLRAVFNVAAGNDDDHGRNHAFLMDGTGAWWPAPAYDLTPAHHPLSSNLRCASVLGRFTDISPSHLVALGREHLLRQVDETLDRVVAAVRRWPEFAAAAGVPQARSDEIAAGMPAEGW